MVLRRNFTHTDVEILSDKKYIAAERKNLSISYGNFQVRETRNSLKVLLQENLKNDNIATDITIKIAMTIISYKNESLGFKKKRFLQTKLPITKTD